MFHEKIPGCDLKANPHIKSRVKLLKRQYFVIVEMMSMVGRGNAKNVTQEVATIEAEREAILSNRQVNENIQVNLKETRMEYEESPTRGVPIAPGVSIVPSFLSTRERNTKKRE
ncbi:hypothetical protein Ahy_A02g007178 [Arachis hypogaea]|uniref:Uncharacterized protein n=1 Tax=Arachis hypogaea TaxID=3818 RepID=A0A445EBU0_ARAHY|nr:hypothetical protein Ahy_A02g007178 [Arachis hypogaea]